ncbi:MAG TPA: HAD family hydrolase [Solirubrobacteraceae bacterium]|nr:HAD family hydrolase [Solirubrobacteraceae bacterium]
MSGRPAAFLDRDGTLNEFAPDPDSGLPESPLSVADVRLIEGAAGAARQLADAGFALVCVSNQPAAAKGKVSLEGLLAVHERVLELLREEGVHLDASRLCLHHPDGVVPELSGPCDCRKPAPGMLLDAADELGLDLASSWMLGDTDSDVLAAHAAGCRAVLIEHPGSAHKRAGGARPDLAASSLADAAAQLLDELAPASSPE